MKHDHHCQCDRCCVARRASRQVKKDVPLPLVVAAWAIIWGSAVVIGAIVMRMFL